MAAELIELEDGILIEIENPDNQIEQISGGMANRVESNMDIIAPILKRALEPIRNTFNELNKDMNIEKAEVTLGLAFEASGNMFIVKGKTKANLSIKLILTPKSE